MPDLSPEDIIRRALPYVRVRSKDLGDQVSLRIDTSPATADAAHAALDALLAERQHDQERVRQLVEALEAVADCAASETIRDAAGIPRLTFTHPCPDIARAALAAMSQGRETPGAAVHEPAPRGWHQFMCRDNPTHIAEIKDTGEATESPFCRRCSKPMVLGGYREAARVPAPPASDDEWTYSTEAADPQDPILAGRRWREALQEITESRESFGDDTLYANHAERVAYNALNRTAPPPAPHPDCYCGYQVLASDGSVTWFHEPPCPLAVPAPPQETA